MSTPPVPDAALVGDVETLLTELVADLDPGRIEPPATGPGRPRVLPTLAVWAGLLVCVLRGATSQRALWRLRCLRGLWAYPRVAVSDEAVYRRLAQAGPAPLERLFHQLTALLAARLATWPVLGTAALVPWARAVVALDETALDPVARSLPALRAVAPGAPVLLPGTLAGVFDLRTQQWRTVRYRAHVTQNEKVLARPLVAALPRHSLILADLGYFGFRWFDDLTDAGQWWVSRLRAKTSYTVIHPYYRQGDTFDGLVWLGAHRADRAKHAVRLLQFRVGPTLHRYVTNVRDPQRLSAADCARLYARRWDIELAVKLVKRELGLHLLWSAKPAVIVQQVWAALIIAQIVQALRLEIAGRAGVDPFDVSLPLLVQYLPQLLARGQDPVAVIVTHGRQVELIRPSRRTVIVAPTIPPGQLATPPPHLVLVRTPRYAGRKCGPRSRPAAA